MIVNFLSPGGSVDTASRIALLTLTCSLLGAAALCQPPRHGLAPSDRPLTGLTGRDGTANAVPVKGETGFADKVTTPGKANPNFLTVTSPSSLWPPMGGVATVYYINANADATDSTDEAANANIQTAVNTFNADFPGLIQWVPWVTGDPAYYVEINLNADDASGECEALEGFENISAQPMGGSAACTVGTILHEMGHIIGLYHEFQRADRSNYVTVNYNNVIKGSWSNFEILTNEVQILGPYDYASVMQYPAYSFSRNGGPVIETIPPGMPLGGAEGVPAQTIADYSAGDKETIERLYGAPPTTVTVTSNPAGLKVVVDGETVTTPQTYAWALNSTHTLSVPVSMQNLSGYIQNSTTPATFYYTYGRWNDNGAQTHTITVLPGNGAAGFPVSSPQVSTYSANFIQLVPYTTVAIYPTDAGTATISPQPRSFDLAPDTFFVARQEEALHAVAASGYSFYEFNNGPYWLPGGLGANPKQFYVPDTGNPVDPTAEFTNTPVYTIGMTPNSFSSNLYAYADGGFFYTPKNFSSYYDSTWTPTSAHTLTLYTPEYPYSSNSRYAFSQWTAGGVVQTPADTTYSITSLPATSTSYVATMIPEFAPANNLNYPPCGGSGTLTPASPTNDGFYPSGTVLTYSATPTPGYTWDFAGWTYDLTGTSTPANLTANDETLVFANFNIVDIPLTLTGLSPSSANTGGAGFTLTLTGTGFSSDSLVIANGTYRTVNYVSPEELQVPLTSADLAAAGAIQVSVENYPQNQGWDGCAVFGYQTFIVQGATLATLTTVSSSANPEYSGSPVTLTARVTSAENNATGTVTFEDGSTVLGTGGLNGSGVATYSVSGLAQGSHAITAVYGGDTNNAGSTSATLNENVVAPPAIASPAPGSMLTNGSVAFAWTPAIGLTAYRLLLGSTGVGAQDIYASPLLPGTSVTVQLNLPSNGETIYARLEWQVNGVWKTADFTFSAP
jgi:Astacin (Peptidase family M12A)/Bacterial Ig-like domain (group 3)